MGLDNRYVIAPSLQEFFIDKDSGLPLSGGKVYFYVDNGAGSNIPKDVFQISGDPNFTYVPLPNPSILSAVGTFQDDEGNDIVPYYFPYSAAGNIELYFIKVYNSDGVLQFTRQGWPNFTDSNVTADQDVTNFIPNGQFLSHNNIVASSANGYVANKVSAPVTNLAQGGWTFERSDASTALDFITFPRYNSSITSPTGNPRYAVQIQTTLAGSDTRKDLCIKFPDVNKFASNELPYNLYFEGESLSGSDITNVQIIVRKFFGTGGSSTTETAITSITLKSGSISTYNIPILFGTNENKSIGTSNDDYVQIVIRLPPTGVQTALFTNFCLTVNSEVLHSFPTQTNAEQLDESTAGWLPTPDPNGFDLYLPIVQTPTGMRSLDTDVGKIFMAMYNETRIGELSCDGTTYLTENYSSDGIPYARLQAKWFSASSLQNYFGNGTNTLIATNTNLTLGATTLRLSVSYPGVSTIADVNTGFGFSNIVTGLTTGCQGYTEGGITSIDKALGARTAPTAGTSGFVINVIRNQANTRCIFEVFNSLPTGLAGTYWTFSTSTGNYFMWFTVDGVGSQPVVAGTPIRVNLRSTYSINEVARCIRAALNGYQTSLISPLIGSSVVAGSYFSVVTPAPFSTNYIVWFTKDGAGSDPNPSLSQAQKIRVDILSSDTIAQVTTKIITAINTKYFAVPDLRGLFARGYDDTGLVDNDHLARLAVTDYFNPLTVGSLQWDEFLAHAHSFGTLSSVFEATDSTFFNPMASSRPVWEQGNFVPPSKNVPVNAGVTAVTGLDEVRPKNFSIRWVVKY